MKIVCKLGFELGDNLQFCKRSMHHHNHLVAPPLQQWKIAESMTQLHNHCVSDQVWCWLNDAKKIDHRVGTDKSEVSPELCSTGSWDMMMWLAQWSDRMTHWE